MKKTSDIYKPKNEYGYIFMFATPLVVTLLTMPVPFPIAVGIGMALPFIQKFGEPFSFRKNLAALMTGVTGALGIYFIKVYL